MNGLETILTAMLMYRSHKTKIYTKENVCKAQTVKLFSVAITETVDSSIH